MRRGDFVGDSWGDTQAAGGAVVSLRTVWGFATGSFWWAGFGGGVIGTSCLGTEVCTCGLAMGGWIVANFYGWAVTLAICTFD